MRIIFISLLLPLLLTSAPLEQSCPRLPSTCTCYAEANDRLSISCEDTILSSLFKDIGSIPLEKLKITGCSQQSLNVVPTVSSLRSLEISNCRIKSINKKILEPFGKTLEELILSNNSLTSVPELGSLPKLVSLNLNANQISDVAENALKDLPSLKYLRLEGNKICSLSTKALSETKESLELLDLSFNCLSAVPAQNLRSSVQLKYLDLSDNKIGEINNFELMNLPQLREVRLNNNQLSSMHPMAFMNVPQLQYLLLKDNLIGELDGNMLQAFKQLEVVDVTNNLLQKMPTLKDLSNLKQVRLDGNLIDKVETLAFSNNPNLQLISLQDNNIRQISRNSFDSLDQLLILLLANNSITSIDRGMFDGMKNLQQLSVRNNSIQSIDSKSFTSVPHLTTLDLAYNSISNVPKQTFERQEKLFWLDLSNNNLTSIVENTFTRKIANILLDGNRLICDNSFDWFVSYLVSNHVRTFLPYQKEITCAGPNKYAGVRLKDLMVKKANDTINQGINTLGLNGQNSQKSLLSSFIPALGGMPNGLNGAAAGMGNLANGVPILSTLTQAIPSLRNLNLNTNNEPQNRNLNSAIEQFTAPLVRFATGGQPVVSDIEQLIKSIPNFIVNIPGLGDVDISKLDPNLVAHVLKGGQIPGVPKETLDQIVHQYMQRMHEAAAAAQAGRLKQEQMKYLPPADKLPQELVTSVMEGQSLPGLDEKQTQVITEYYTKAVATGQNGNPLTGKNGVFTLTPDTLEMLKLLPPGYDVTKIPKEIIQALSNGEIPDLKKLPKDLLDHFRTHTDKIALLFSKATSANATIEQMLDKLPQFEKPRLATFSPYDINELSSDMIHEEEEAARAAKMRVWTAIALGLVGALTIVVLVFFVFYLKKQRRLKKAHSDTIMAVDNARPGLHPTTPLANSTMRGSISTQLHLRPE